MANKLFLHVPALLMPGACSALDIGDTEFGCPGKPRGVSCLSTREVYALTDGRAGVTDAKLDPDEPAAPPALVPARTQGGALPVVAASSGPTPIRSPPRIMRVWIAPFEDANGDLHLTGYLYTEIQPRRWEIGGGPRGSANPRVFTPLEGSFQTSSRPTPGPPPGQGAAPPQPTTSRGK